MSFPYTYSDTITFSKNELSSKKLRNIIIKELTSGKLSGYSENKESGLLKTSSPFLKIPFQINIEVTNSEISYSVHLEYLIKIILAVIIFSALFSYTSLSFFFWFSSLFSVIFYIFNILIINSFVNSSILKILKKYKLISSEKEILTTEQEQWLNDKNRCPACGKYLSDIDLICPECGLHLKRSRHTIPLDTSKYKNEPVKYYYKKK